MNFSALDAFMDDMPARGYPACELAVTKDGKTVYRRGVGFSDGAMTKPVSPDNIYWIFSATKVITCIAAMMLVDRGVIALDDPVSKYVPEYAELVIRARDGSLSVAKNTMTVEHLFTMTGGMTYNLKTASTLPLIERGNASTLELVRAMAHDPLIFEPGTDYAYSLCHDVLAAVVEVASGMKFSEFLEKELFVPLGVRDMGFRPTDEQKARFSAMYNYNAGTGISSEIPVGNKFILSNQYDSGGAGLFATVDDYMKIITAVACGGTAENGYRVLSPEAVRMMGENRVCAKGLASRRSGRLYGYGWGLGCRVHMDPVVSLSRAPVGEFGWDGAANAFAMVDATNRVAVYFGAHILGCTYGYNLIHPHIRNLIYEGLEK